MFGIEAEFSLYVEGAYKTPEEMFGSPSAIIPIVAIPRIGKSVPTLFGGAIYFDNGVIEVVTPPFSTSRWGVLRAVRNTWQHIAFLRRQLNYWSERTNRRARLSGFSVHYNISDSRLLQRLPEQLRDLTEVLLLTLHSPVMLLATNRSSSGVGVRVKSERIEITVDFTPSVGLLTATAVVVAGIVNAILDWKEPSRSAMRTKGIPLIRDFHPKPQQHGIGFQTRANSYARNPFNRSPDATFFVLETDEELTLREVARQTMKPFWNSIARFANKPILRVISRVASGHEPALLDYRWRPAEYEDIALIKANGLFSAMAVAFDDYEGALRRIVSGDRLLLDGRLLTPRKILGWFDVLFDDELHGKEYYLDRQQILSPEGFWISKFP